MAVKIADLDMPVVRNHYMLRYHAHKKLRKHFEASDIHAFAQLALGISDPVGNYSAAEHRMGPIILATASEQDIFDLAMAIEACPKTTHLPDLIYSQGIKNLKISIGSEIAMMMKPTVH